MLEILSEPLGVLFLRPVKITNKKIILKYELTETATDIFVGTRICQVFQAMCEFQKGVEMPYFYQRCPILPLLLCRMHLQDKIPNATISKKTNT